MQLAFFNWTEQTWKNAKEQEDLKRNCSNKWDISIELDVRRLDADDGSRRLVTGSV